MDQNSGNQNGNQGDAQGGQGEVRHPNPAAAAQDPDAAARQEQVHRDSQANREQAERVRATTPPEVRDRTVGEIVEEAERRADADRNS